MREMKEEKVNLRCLIYWMLEHSISCFRISNGPGSVSNNLIQTLFVQNHKDNDVIESVQAANCTGLSQDLCCGSDVVVTWPSNSNNTPTAVVSSGQQHHRTWAGQWILGLTHNREFFSSCSLPRPWTPHNNEDPLSRCYNCHLSIWR